MPIVRSHHKKRYWAEYGVLYLRDSGDHDPVDDGVPAVNSLDLHPGGSVALAGDGWLQGSAVHDDVSVRLELHDGPPEDDRDAWEEVVETCYLSPSGRIGLDHLTGMGEVKTRLKLAGSGPHRVRISRRGEDAQEWSLRFWPVGAPELPLWLKRTSPAADPEPSGWDDLLPGPARALRWAVAALAEQGLPATLATIDAWGQANRSRLGVESGPRRGVPWLDTPLDLDEEEKADLTLLTAVAELPLPEKLGGLLPLLSALGLLTGDAATGLREAESPPTASEVVTLSPERLTELAGYHAFLRFAGLSSDLAATVAWSPDATLTTTPQELAERLRTTPADLLGALAHAVDQNLLTSEETADGRLTLTVFADGPDDDAFTLDEDDIVVDEDVSPAEDLNLSAVRSIVSEPPPGPPPRAGVIDERGRLLVWREGRPIELGRFEAVESAIETAHGIVVTRYGPRTVLVRPDGGRVKIGKNLSPLLPLDREGHVLAAVESRQDRLVLHTALHAIDLSDGSRVTLPWPDDDEHLHLIGTHDGHAYFHAGDPATPATYRWRPGEPPALLPTHLQAIDPLSGTVLAVPADADGPLLVITPGGIHHLPFVPDAALTPGGKALYSATGDPATITLFPLDDPAPRIHRLPDGCEPALATWESPTRLLIPRHWTEADAVRLNIRDGSLQTVPLLEKNDGYPLFVRPLHRAHA